MRTIRVHIYEEILTMKYVSSYPVQLDGTGKNWIEFSQLYPVKC